MKAKLSNNVNFINKKLYEDCFVKKYSINLNLLKVVYLKFCENFGQ